MNCITEFESASLNALPSLLLKERKHMYPIDHIGIAVANLEASISLFEKLLNTPCYKIEEVPSEQVRTAFFQTGESKIELVGSDDPSGVISRFIEKKGEGIHHIAFAVTNIEAEIKRLKEEGFQFIQETPRPGADNKMVVFLHPKSSNGVLIELVADKK